MNTCSILKPPAFSLMLKRFLHNICLKLMAGFIYLSFFVVQFNIHLSGTPQNISYFSCDYSSINNKECSANPNHHLIRTDSRHSNFKLNKRFHPERLFAVTSLPDIVAALNYKTQTALVHEKDPLTNYSFNSPSLRGPPVLV
jgi:hypothetical protein